MKRKTKILIKAIIFCLITIMFSTINYATTGSMFLGLKGKDISRDTGTYTFNNKAIFKIVKFNEQGTTEIGDNTAIYCLKAGPGFGSESYENNIVRYTQYFDLKNPDAIESPYDKQLPEDPDTYNQLIWVLDHLYIPAKTGASSDEIRLAEESKRALLDNAGVAEDSFLRDEATYGDEIEDILESIQQVAIWYFTNPDGDYHNPYDDRLEIRVDGESLIDKYGLDFVDNEIDLIYSYLVQGAIDAVNSGFTYEDSIVGSSPINFVKDSATVTMESTNYIIGPYRINETSNIEYNLNVTLTDGSTTIQNAKVLNADKQEITNGSTISEKIGTTIGSDFYISIPISTNINQIRLRIGAEYFNTTQTYWSVGQASLVNNQPVVIISRDKQNYNDESIVPITSPEFDLALRKFITEINGTQVEQSREPDITQEDLQNLATGRADFDNGTTVTKTHTKTPLIINNGDKIGIIGQVGSGKTTLMNIISGFYEIPEGMVLINGEDISKYRKDDLFSKYNYALQQNIILDDTIKANVDITENLEDNEFKKIIKNAELEEDIQKLEEKEETLVGEKGVKLSGGQKQRVSIARNLSNAREINIFDDTLSALDSNTEKKIMNNLLKEVGDSTLIVISNKISSVEKLDKIYVLLDGKIEDCGTHEELLKRNDFYKEVYMLEKKEEEDEIYTKEK